MRGKITQKQEVKIEHLYRNDKKHNNNILKTRMGDELKNEVDIIK